MGTIYTGTAHFVSLESARRYFKDYGYTYSDVVRKERAGEIHIGKPAVQPGEFLTVIDGGTRYAIGSVE
jgi:hypothetical protein